MEPRVALDRDRLDVKLRSVRCLEALSIRGLHPSLLNEPDVKLFISLWPNPTSNSPFFISSVVGHSLNPTWEVYLSNNKNDIDAGEDTESAFSSVHSSLASSREFTLRLHLLTPLTHPHVMSIPENEIWDVSVRSSLLTLQSSTVSSLNSTNSINPGLSSSNVGHPGLPPPLSSPQTSLSLTLGGQGQSVSDALAHFPPTVLTLHISLPDLKPVTEANVANLLLSPLDHRVLFFVNGEALWAPTSDLAYISPSIAGINDFTSDSLTNSVEVCSNEPNAPLAASPVTVPPPLPMHLVRALSSTGLSSEGNELTGVTPPPVPLALLASLPTHPSHPIMEESEGEFSEADTEPIIDPENDNSIGFEAENPLSLEARSENDEVLLSNARVAKNENDDLSTDPLDATNSQIEENLKNPEDLHAGDLINDEEIKATVDPFDASDVSEAIATSVLEVFADAPFPPRLSASSTQPPSNLSGYVVVPPPPSTLGLGASSFFTPAAAASLPPPRPTIGSMVDENFATLSRVGSVGPNGMMPKPPAAPKPAHIAALPPVLHRANSSAPPAPPAFVRSSVSPSSTTSSSSFSTVDVSSSPSAANPPPLPQLNINSLLSPAYNSLSMTDATRKSAFGSSVLTVRSAPSAFSKLHPCYVDNRSTTISGVNRVLNAENLLRHTLDILKIRGDVIREESILSTATSGLASTIKLNTSLNHTTPPAFLLPSSVGLDTRPDPFLRPLSSPILSSGVGAGRDSPLDLLRHRTVPPPPSANATNVATASRVGSKPTVLIPAALQSRAAHVVHLRTLIEREREAIQEEKQALREEREELTLRAEAVLVSSSKLLAATDAVTSSRAHAFLSEQSHLEVAQHRLDLRRRRILSELVRLFPITHLSASENAEQQMQQQMMMQQQGTLKRPGFLTKGPVTLAPRTQWVIVGLPLTANRAWIAGKANDPVALDTTSTALGYAASLVHLLSHYLSVPLRYRVVYRGSRSLIFDDLAIALNNTQSGPGGATSGPGMSGKDGKDGKDSKDSKDPNNQIPPHAYPLYYVLNDERFFRGVELLNKNIQYLISCRIGLETKVPQSDNILENLHYLLQHEVPLH